MPLVGCPDCGRQVSDEALACVQCGRHMHTTVPTGRRTRPSALHCPRCGSDDLRSLSVVHASGVSHTQGFSGGTGLAFGTDDDPTIVGGGLSSSSVQHTALARAAAPPEPQTLGVAPAVFVGGVAALMLYLLGFWRLGLIGLIPATVLGGVAGYAWYQRQYRAIQEYNETVYRPQRASWERKVMCLRCGAITERPASAGQV